MIVLSIHMNNFVVYSIIHVFYIWSSICREDLVFFLQNTINIILRKQYMYVHISLLSAVYYIYYTQEMVYVCANQFSHSVLRNNQHVFIMNYFAVYSKSNSSTYVHTYYVLTYVLFLCVLLGSLCISDPSLYCGREIVLIFFLIHMLTLYCVPYCTTKMQVDMNHWKYPPKTYK